MHHSPFSNICDQCNRCMHKLLQIMVQLRDNLGNMRQNSCISVAIVISIPISALVVGQRLSTSKWMDPRSNYLCASCSQPFDVDDVVCNESSKGTFLLLDFWSKKVSATHACPGATFACAPRSYVVCNRGEFFDSPGSVHI